MPRHKNCRKIKCYPDHWCFECEDGESEISLTLDEYEVIRLIDLEKRTHEECALEIGVARTTVTAIYESAREKIARFLCEGGRLTMSGGSYELLTTTYIKKKRSGIMRIAVTYEKDTGMIFGHFGHTEYFKIYDVEENKIVSSEVVSSDGLGHGALAGFLKASGVDILICGGIGVGAQLALDEAEIELYGGNGGSADEAVIKLLEGKLDQDSEANCDHHHEHEEGCHCHDHGHDHDCGCGQHNG